MDADSGNATAFDAALLSRLACPACLGSLQLQPDTLICAACGKVYPIVEGIAVLVGQA